MADFVAVAVVAIVAVIVVIVVIGIFYYSGGCCCCGGVGVRAVMVVAVGYSGKVKIKHLDTSLV